jgi:predicted HicB family RNase H-like nuclease
MPEKLHRQRRQQMKQLLIRLSKADHKALKQLALDRDTSMNTLILQMIEILVKKEEVEK